MNAQQIGGAIILAAGHSSRFGADKRRATLPSGLTLLEATVTRYTEVFDHLLIMLRRDEQALAALINARLTLPTQRVGFSARAVDGMGYTLADGIALVASHWQYAFVALGDMPFVTRDTLLTLRDTWTARTPAQWIIQPLHGEAPGHPVGFARELFPALAALTADRGARGIVQAHISKVRRVMLDDGGILADVDTPAALAASPAAGAQ